MSQASNLTAELLSQVDDDQTTNSDLTGRSTQLLQESNNNLHSTHHHHACHSHGCGLHKCYCIKKLYDGDEVCMKQNDQVKFGFISDVHGILKILWNEDQEIHEEPVRSVDYTDLRLMDRVLIPGDLLYVNKKQGEVLEVSWTAILKLQENQSVLLDIPCECLVPLVPYYAGQKVVEDNGWIGTITHVRTEATLMFSKGRTAVVDCSALPHDQQPYPGRKVNYTLEQLTQAGLEKLNNRKLKELLQLGESLEAFVLFLNVGTVHVTWNGRITVLQVPNDSKIGPPPTTLSRSFLKRNVKVLGTLKDIDWDCHAEATDQFYTYSVKGTDAVLLDGNVDGYLESKYFGDNEPGIVCVEKGSKSRIMTNVDHVCKVIKLNRILKVKWLGSGKVDRIRANIVTCKHSFNQPFRQIVQRKLLLAPYSCDEYGVTLTRELNDTLAVKWLHRPNDVSTASSATADEHSNSPVYRTKYQSLESLYDLVPHYCFGRIRPRSIVYRSVNCTLPEPLFSIGWVRSISHTGKIVVISLHTRAEHSVYPNELECTGVRIDEDEEEETNDPLVGFHGLYNLQISEQLFIQNLSSIENCTRVPDHFNMYAKAPSSHKFYNAKFLPQLDGKWNRAVKRDQLHLSIRLQDLATLWIKGFKDRPDLYSVLMAGLQGTPYEGGLYTFDVQLNHKYPNEPPVVACTTVFGWNEELIRTDDLKSLLLDGNTTQPFKLLDSVVALQAGLFTDLMNNGLTLDSKKREHDMKIVVGTLDLMFRNVFDPPHLWVNECLQYFKMSYERIKKMLVKVVDGVPMEGVDYDVQPASDGWIDAVVGRLRRFDELLVEVRVDESLEE